MKKDGKLSKNKKNKNKVIWRISPELRNSLNENDMNNTPGPGQYNIRERIFTGPKYSIRPKNYNLYNKKNKICDSFYEIRDNKSRGPIYSFPHERRMLYFEKNIPGPGNYSLRRDIPMGPSFEFSKAKRRFLEYDISKYIPGQEL